MFHTPVLCAMSDDVVLCVARVTQRNNRENTAKLQKGSIIIFLSASHLLVKYFARILLRKPSSSLKLLVQSVETKQNDCHAVVIYFYLRTNAVLL